jgi:hypothetical protein
MTGRVDWPIWRLQSAICKPEPTTLRTDMAESGFEMMAIRANAGAIRDRTSQHYLGTAEIYGDLWEAWNDKRHRRGRWATPVHRFRDLSRTLSRLHRLGGLAIAKLPIRRTAL